VAGHFLVVVWDGGGNVVPAAGLTASLVKHGHDVRVIGPAVLQTRFERAGARFRPFTRAQPPHSREGDVYDDNLIAWARFISGRSLAEDVLEELRSEPTDVAVIDALLSGGFAAAEKVGVPVVPLVHVLYAPAIEGPASTQWDPTRRLIEITRRHLEVPELDPATPVMAELWRRCPILLACAPQSFDFPVEHLPANARYVGPILDEPMGSSLQQGGGRVLISFSTTAMRQGDVIQRCLDALAGLDVEVVCTLGGIQIDGLSAPPNASIFDWVSHRELLPSTDVVVTHAGLSTVMASLASGVPLVCLPMGREQPLNAERVATLGLGLDLPPTASADVIRDAVEAVLNDESFRQQAKSMAETIAGYGNGTVAVQELESLL
jgi:MGT family glycosyltransferase